MPIGRLSKGKNYYHISYIIFQLQHIMTVFLARGHSQNVVESQTEPFFLHSWQIFKIIYNPSFLQDFCANSNTVIQCNKPALHTKFFQIFITVFLNVNTRKEMSSSTSISLPSFSFFFFFYYHFWNMAQLLGCNLHWCESVQWDRVFPLSNSNYYCSDVISQRIYQW